MSPIAINPAEMANDAVKIFTKTVDVLNDRPFSKSTSALFYILSIAGLRTYSLPKLRLKNTPDDEIPQCCKTFYSKMSFIGVPFAAFFFFVIFATTIYSTNEVFCWYWHCGFLSAATATYIQKIINGICALLNILVPFLLCWRFHEMLHKMDSVSKRKVPRFIGTACVAVLIALIVILMFTLYGITKTFLVQNNIWEMNYFQSYQAFLPLANTIMTSITLPLTWLPVGLYVLLCLHLIICFNWAYTDLLKCDLTEEQLIYGHMKYLKAITLTNLVDSVYAYVVFYEVTLTTLNTMFGIYGIIKLFPHSPSALFTSEYFGQVIICLLIILFYIIPPIIVYETKDDFLLLLKDRDWPLSYGHFIVLERNFLLTMIGLVVSALIIWIEFGKDANFECALFNELQKNNTNSLTILHCPTI